MNKTIRKIVIAVIALITIVSVSGIAPVSAQTSAPAFNFTRNLTIGSTGEDVRALQQFLNSRNFTVATTGAGSPGNETTRFGPRTQSALIRFQTANNISPARGFFGPITRGVIMELANAPVTTAPVTTTPVTTAPITAGTLSSVISPATPVATIVPVGTTGAADIPVTIVRYTATNEPVILQDITVNPITTRRSIITSVEIVDGARIISMPVPATGAIVFRDANIEIPATGHRDIIVRADLAGDTPGVITRFRLSDLMIELDVQVTRASGRNSGANITTGLNNITDGHVMTAHMPETN